MFQAEKGTSDKALITADISKYMDPAVISYNLKGASREHVLMMTMRALVRAVIQKSLILGKLCRSGETWPS